MIFFQIGLSLGSLSSLSCPLLLFPDDPVDLFLFTLNLLV